MMGTINRSGRLASAVAAGRVPGTIAGFLLWNAIGVTMLIEWLVRHSYLWAIL